MSGKRGKLLRALAKKCLQRLEGSWTYFLPYRHSSIRNDALFAMIEQLSREAKPGSILIHGAVASDPGTESCLLGASQSVTRPDVICVTREQKTLKKLQRRKRQAEQITCLDLPIKAIKQQAGIKSFGLAVITEHETDAADYDDVPGSDVIVIIGVSRASNAALYRELLSDAMYTLAVHIGAHRDGYAVFRRATLQMKTEYTWKLVTAH